MALGYEPYRLAVSPRDVPDQVEVLKEGDLVVVTLPSGEIPAGNMGGVGLYSRDTRYLSCMEFYVEDRPWQLLSATTRRSHFMQAELSNQQMVLGDGTVLPRHSLHLRVLRVIRGALYQRFRFINFYPRTVSVTFKIVLGADYVDIFEVRGVPRLERGHYLDVVSRPQGFIFGYVGRDGVRRSTVISFDPVPRSQAVQNGLAIAEFKLNLPPQKKIYLNMKIVPVSDDRPVSQCSVRDLHLGFAAAAIAQEKSYLEWRRQCTSIVTNNEVYNHLFERYITDLRALSTEYPGAGTIVEAGIPWYAAPFGRDSLITSWQTLMVNPEIAKSALRFLARYQGKEVNELREEQPGKILHELRFGEMAATGQVLSMPYYGSVDSTLWFLIVLGETFRWTADRDFLQEMVEPLRNCLKWCEEYGDMDGDCYIEYQRLSPQGLDNQGWKDSCDGVLDRDGVLPKGPIALVEVQAYYYAALNQAAYLFRQLGEDNEARRLEFKAARLKAKFIRDFWLEDEQFLAFALDGDKRRVRAVVSNAGHCLFTGILPTDLAVRVSQRLFQPDMYSGWGIRTRSKKETPYNPMSYHNGSVWPHDNSITARGLREYELFSYLERLEAGLMEAALWFPYYRLPELFCGFTRRAVGGPVKYPVACDPQAWAIGSVFLILQSMLGISSQGEELYVRKPRLPEGVDELNLYNMSAGKGKVDLEFARGRGRTYCHVLHQEGVRVIMEA